MKFLHLNTILLAIYAAHVNAGLTWNGLTLSSGLLNLPNGRALANDDCASVSWTGEDPTAGDIGNGAVEHCPGKLAQGLGIDITCTPIPCQKDQGCDTCCKVGDGTYEEGCCLGTDPTCAEEDQCYEGCPDFEEICTAPAKDSEGNDLWSWTYFVQGFDCINTGYKTVSGDGTELERQDGLTYKWAIVSGPMISGRTNETNYGPGQYAVRAYRTGGGLTHEEDGLASPLLPAHWLQLGECGCGPIGMPTFGLPDPTKPCLTEDDCIFLAQDAPGDVAKNFCHAFDKFSDEEGYVAIDYYEKALNFLGLDLFGAVAPTDGNIDINVVEDVSATLPPTEPPSATAKATHCATPIIITAGILFQLFMA